MVPFIRGPRELHGVTIVTAYLASQARHIQRNAARGMRYMVHRDDTRVVAFVAHNAWLTSCPCGANPATDPRWGVACCYGCGAVLRNIAWPVAWEVGERLLLARPDPRTRHWLPGETVEQLAAENVAHGISEAA